MLALDFLPREIGEFRKQNPFVAFDVKVFDYERAMAPLAEYEVDLVLVFRPPFLANFQPLMTLEQRIVVVMSAGHPLAGRATVRLRDCAAYPVALPERSIGGGNCSTRSAPTGAFRFRSRRNPTPSNCSGAW